MASVNYASLLVRCTFPGAGESAVCAVSGGADSVAMLLLAREAKCELRVIHVNHHIREESHLDAKFVSVLCEELRVPCEIIDVEVAPGPNLEARARAARHSVMPADALFAHTADDQAETMLLNLMRGSGLRGLGGIAIAQHPILSLRRSETHAVCADAGVTPVFDASNADPSFRRNRVRSELLPLLDDIAQRDVAEVMARTAQVIGRDDAFLDQLASQIDATDCVALRSAPEVLAFRCIRQWLQPQLIDDSGEMHPPSWAAAERVMAVVRNEVLAADIARGVRVRRSRNKLFLETDNGASTSA